MRSLFFSQKEQFRFSQMKPPAHPVHSRRRSNWEVQPGKASPPSLVRIPQGSDHPQLYGPGTLKLSQVRSFDAPANGNCSSCDPSGGHGKRQFLASATLPMTRRTALLASASLQLARQTAFLASGGLLVGRRAPNLACAARAPILASVLSNRKGSAGEPPLRSHCSNSC